MCLNILIVVVDRAAYHALRLLAQQTAPSDACLFFNSAAANFSLQNYALYLSGGNYPRYTVTFKCSTYFANYFENAEGQK